MFNVTINTNFLLKSTPSTQERKNEKHLISTNMQCTKKRLMVLEWTIEEHLF